MKNQFLSKLLLFFSAIFLFVYGIIYACGGGWDFNDFSFDSNFTPETFVDASYEPLFLSGDVFYSIGFEDNYNTRFNASIRTDWETYLKGKADSATVHYFLFDSSAVAVQDIYAFYKTKKSTKNVEIWDSKLKLKDTKIKNFIDFLYLAKQIETVSVNTDYWSYDPVPVKTFKKEETVKTIEANYKNTKNAFLKNRYWFQTMKAYFYSDNRKEAFDFFQKTEATVPKNELYYRALSYLAGFYYKEKEYAKSNYLYAIVFDKCPEMRIVSAYNFHPQEENDWNASLAMAKDNQEKAALWAIQGYYKDEVRAVEKIFELDPKSAHLDYLLTRLINKTERNMNHSFSKTVESNDVKKQTVSENKSDNKKKIDAEVLGLVTKIAGAGTTVQPYLWDMALGYLYTLTEDFSKAEAFYTKVEQKMPAKKLAHYQLRLLRFVNNLSKIEKLTAQNEKTIIKDLNWLYHELPKEKGIPEFRFWNATKWSKKYLASLYNASGNRVMAELFDYTNDYWSWSTGNSFYDSSLNLLAMKNFLTKTNKTDLEQVGESIYGVKLAEINNFQAVKATFKNDIPAAIEFMKQSDSLQNIVFYGNPFNGGIKDCHDCDHVAYQKRKYSQLDFLTTIKTMQDKILAKEEVYTNSLLLGNAFYNITHFGNARMFYESQIAGYGSTPYSFRAPIKKMITDCSLAKMYYQKAFEAAKNKEQKAKCLYMMAKCERNEYYNKKYSAIESVWEIPEEEVNFIAFDGFVKLKTNYSDTKYYQEVIGECGYFRTYVNQ
ncbi:hypothetical protein SAMN05444143_101401 [Flavobacterium succinicans]|uniref:Tetratricopeptide repeat protein n=1 Tax=Flavobacterium succinicans TaxID=29536 RepID=A0A1I4RKE2_9FLAO|nr:hypothetical protein [Flavobacterium succinicans]SFM52679.1 hypothetical protein SAMN05444143_101401 [Flavobacterium succinicans]